MRLTPFRVLSTFLLGLCLFGAFYLQPWFRTVLFASVFQGAYGRNTVSSISFDLPEGRWLSFSLPPTHPSVKLVANAIISGRRKIPVYDPLRFSLDYEFLSATGQVIYSDTYHLETGLTLYHSETASDPEPGWFFFDSTLTPADPASAVFDLKSLERKGLAKVRFRVNTLDKRMAGVNTRVYVKQRVSENRAQQEWQRLTAKEKEMLVRANVLGSQLISEDERINVLRERWEPIAPSGVAGVDYVQRKLFRLFDPPQRLPSEEILPEGEEIGARYYATIPVPVTGGQIELVFHRGSRRGQAQAMEVQVLWYGRDLSERKEFSFVTSKQKATFHEKISGGLLEIRSNVSASVDAFLKNEKSRERITPPPLFTRTYVVNEANNIRYRLLSGTNLANTIRVDIRRRLSPDTDSFGEAKFLLRFLNASFQEIDQYTVESGALIPSTFDRALVPEGAQAVSDVESFYIKPPKTVSFLEINSLSDEILVSVYNRPSELVPVSLVPDDYQYAERLESGRRKWHTLSAPDHAERLKAGGTQLLKIRMRPPEDNPKLLAGEYEFEQFVPNGKWFGRYIFSPYNSRHTERTELLPVLFTPLTGQQTVSLGGEPWEQSVAPQLLVLSEQDASNTITVLLDGTEILSQTARRTPALLSLPHTQVGDHEIEVHATQKNTKYYLNQTANSDNTYLLMQFVQQITETELRYSVDKREVLAETLSLRFFPLAKSEAPTRLQVELLMKSKPESAHPSKGITFQRRTYVIHPSEGRGVPILDAKDPTIGNGELFFFTLDEDIPAGSYTVIVKRLSGSDGYLRVSRVLPGKFEKQEVVKTRAVGSE